MQATTMKMKLEAFEKKPPLAVFQWNDEETEARGWLVINSLRGNACGGGTRMRKGCTQQEVLALASTGRLVSLPVALSVKTLSSFIQTVDPYSVQKCLP